MEAVPFLGSLPDTTYILMVLLLFYFFTLAGGSTDYFWPCVNSSDCSNCFFHVLFFSPAAGSFLPCQHWSVPTWRLEKDSLHVSRALFVQLSPLCIHLCSALEYYPVSSSCLGLLKLLILSSALREAEALFNSPIAPTVAWKPYR